MGDDALGYRLVIERPIDIVGGGGGPDIGRHLQVETHGLANLSLPIEYTDDGIDIQIADINGIHQASTAVRLSSGQRGAARTPRSSACPANRR